MLQQPASVASTMINTSPRRSEISSSMSSPVGTYPPTVVDTRLQSLAHQAAPPSLETEGKTQQPKLFSSEHASHRFDAASADAATSGPLARTQPPASGAPLLGDPAIQYQAPGLEVDDSSKQHCVAVAPRSLERGDVPSGASSPFNSSHIPAPRHRAAVLNARAPRSVASRSSSEASSGIPSPRRRGSASVPASPRVKPLGGVRVHSSQADLTGALARPDSAGSAAHPVPLGGARAHGSQAELTFALQRNESNDGSVVRGAADAMLRTHSASPPLMRNANSSGTAHADSSTRSAETGRGDSNSRSRGADGSTESGDTDNAVSSASLGGRAMPIAGMAGASTLLVQAELYTITEAGGASEPLPASAASIEPANVIVEDGVRDARDARDASVKLTSMRSFRSTSAVPRSTASEQLCSSGDVGRSGDMRAAGYDADYDSTALLRAEDPDLFDVSPDVEGLFTAMRREGARGGATATLSTLRQTGSASDSSGALTRRVAAAESAIEADELAAAPVGIDTAVPVKVNAGANVDTTKGASDGGDAADAVGGSQLSAADATVPTPANAGGAQARPRLSGALARSCGCLCSSYSSFAPVGLCAYKRSCERACAASGGAWCTHRQRSSSRQAAARSLCQLRLPPRWLYLCHHACAAWPAAAWQWLWRRLWHGRGRPQVPAALARAEDP